MWRGIKIGFLLSHNSEKDLETLHVLFVEKWVTIASLQFSLLLEPWVSQVDIRSRRLWDFRWHFRFSKFFRANFDILSFTLKCLEESWVVFIVSFTRWKCSWGVRHLWNVIIEKGVYLEPFMLTTYLEFGMPIFTLVYTIYKVANVLYS